MNSKPKLPLSVKIRLKGMFWIAGGGENRLKQLEGDKSYTGRQINRPLPHV